MKDDGKWWEKTDICAPASKGKLKEIDYHRYWKTRAEEAEEALANALAQDERMKDADSKMILKLERIQELEQINEDHKKMNGNLRREITALEQEKLELHADNKKLAAQVEDYVDRLRKAAVI
jgi:septal ring factor EnvC (AmiA/AmiB activator)